MAGNNREMRRRRCTYRGKRLKVVERGTSMAGNSRGKELEVVERGTCMAGINWKLQRTQYILTGKTGCCEGRSSLRLGIARRFDGSDTCGKESVYRVRNITPTRQVFQASDWLLSLHVMRWTSLSCDLGHDAYLNWWAQVYNAVDKIVFRAFDLLYPLWVFICGVSCMWSKLKDTSLVHIRGVLEHQGYLN